MTSYGISLLFYQTCHYLCTEGSFYIQLLVFTICFQEQVSGAEMNAPQNNPMQHASQHEPAAPLPNEPASSQVLSDVRITSNTISDVPELVISGSPPISVPTQTLAGERNLPKPGLNDIDLAKFIDHPPVAGSLPPAEPLLGQTPQFDTPRNSVDTQKMKIEHLNLRLENQLKRVNVIPPSPLPVLDTVTPPLPSRVPPAAITLPTAAPDSPSPTALPPEPLLSVHISSSPSPSAEQPVADSVTIEVPSLLPHSPPADASSMPSSSPAPAPPTKQPASEPSTITLKPPQSPPVHGSPLPSSPPAEQSVAGPVVMPSEMASTVEFRSEPPSAVVSPTMAPKVVLEPTVAATATPPATQATTPPHFAFGEPAPMSPSGTQDVVPKPIGMNLQEHRITSDSTEVTTVSLPHEPAATLTAASQKLATEKPPDQMPLPIESAPASIEILQEGKVCLVFRDIRLVSWHQYVTQVLGSLIVVFML